MYRHTFHNLFPYNYFLIAAYMTFHCFLLLVLLPSTLLLLLLLLIMILVIIVIEIIYITFILIRPIIRMCTSALSLAYLPSHSHCSIHHDIANAAKEDTDI